MKDAYHKLCDETQRNTAIMNIEYVRKEVMKERKKLINKGVSLLSMMLSNIKLFSYLIDERS